MHPWENTAGCRRNGPQSRANFTDCYLIPIAHIPPAAMDSSFSVPASIYKSSFGFVALCGD